MTTKWTVRRWLRHIALWRNSDGVWALLIETRSGRVPLALVLEREFDGSVDLVLHRYSRTEHRVVDLMRRRLRGPRS